MLTFEIYNEPFFLIFGAYITFFGVAFGISHAIDQLVDKSK